MKKVDFSKVSVKSWIKGSLALGALLFVTIWTGNPWVLLFAPIVFDMYITKLVHWCFWLPKDGSKPTMLIEWLDAILYALFWVYLINIFLFQNYKIPTSSLEKSLLIGDHLAVSKISYGPNMPVAPIYMPLTQNTMPILNCKSYLEWPLWNYHRLTGLGQVERKDIVVFNFPAGDTVCINYSNPDYYTTILREGRGYVNDHPELRRAFDNEWDRNHYLESIGRQIVWSVKDSPMIGGITWRPVDKRDCYVKRCIGLPGDTIEIRHNVVYVNGELLEDAPNAQHNYTIETTGISLGDKFFEQLGISNQDRNNAGFGSPYNMPLTKENAKKVESMPIIKSIRIDEEMADSTGSSVYPYSRDYKWSRDNYGPIWMPKKGATVKLDNKNIRLYERIITAYERHTLDYKGGKIYVDGKETDEYTFDMDYYWMMGDNRHMSADSRYWGFVPEDHIVGKPVCIWLSIDEDKPWYNCIRWNRFFKSVE